MIHELKITPEYFEAVQEEVKTFEVRLNDRDYAVVDHLALNEFNGEYSGRCMLVRIAYILNDIKYCKEGYVILSIFPCAIVDRYGHFNRMEETNHVSGIRIYDRQKPN